MDETVAGSAFDESADPPVAVDPPVGEISPVSGGVELGRRRPSAGVIIGRTVVALVSAVALAATGIAWYTLQEFRAHTNTTNALAAANSGADDLGGGAPPADDGTEDILLVGSDSRTDAQGNPLPTDVLSQELRTTFDAGVNTDTIIILRIPKNGGRAYAVSIPRDSYVSIPGIGSNKINSAYGLTMARKQSQLAGSGQSQQAINQQANQAGQEALIESVQNLTGIRIDHYAQINLYGFYLLSKAIGGVTVCLKHATSDKDSGASFPAGKQTISGAAALSFVRQRENLPNGDLSRIVRQQVFLAAAAKKVLSAGVLANPSALAALMDTVHKSLYTDPGLDLLSLAQQAQALASGNVEFVTIPVVNINGRSPSGQSIVVVDPAQVHQFLTNLVNPAPPTSATAPSSAAPTSSAPTSSAAPPPATTAAPPPATAQTPTAPVSIDGVPCVD